MGCQPPHANPAHRHRPAKGLTRPVIEQSLQWGQRPARENKKAKGFNMIDVPLESCLLQGEVAEAFDVWRKGREDVGEELADIAIYLFSLAEMTGVALQDEVEAKLAKNADRSYRLLPNGVLARKDDGRTASA